MIKGLAETYYMVLLIGESEYQLAQYSDPADVALVVITLVGMLEMIFLSEWVRIIKLCRWRGIL